MTPDWKALTPNRPLDPGAAAYVPPPSEGGRRIADWILAGGATVLVGGTVGIGRSTELAQAARRLQGERVACLVQLDRLTNMRRITADEAREAIAGRVADFATRVLGIQLSEPLRVALEERGLLDTGRIRGPWRRVNVSPAQLLEVTLKEVARHSRQGRVSLLVDGTEKVPPGAASLELFDALGELPVEEVDLAVVVPWQAAFGPQAEQVVRPGERMEMLRPPAVEGPEGEAGRTFLRTILAQRLRLPAETLAPSAGAPAVQPGDERPPADRLELFNEASRWSGGVPRLFLQLIANAATYARLRRDDPWPDATDLADSVADLRDGFRRILLPGDTAAIRAAEGTEGRELDLGRKIRLMAHGVLLERLVDRRPKLEIHPLARAAVADGEPTASRRTGSAGTTASTSRSGISRSRTGAGWASRRRA